MKKHDSRYNYIVQQETHSRVRQWHFSGGQVFAALGLVIVLSGAFLFFSADFLTQLIYKNKLMEIKRNYHSLTSSITDIQSRLNVLNMQMGQIEEKDRAIRTYADLPLIDQDIRKLGIGGVRLETSSTLESLVPEVKDRITDLELDIDKLSRQVKLELSSYASIYDKVKLDSEKMRSIPSIRPVMGGYLNSTFGYRNDPLDGKVRFHYGQDITLPAGSPVMAPASGRVTEVRYRGGFGKYVKITHGHGYSSLFAHLSSFKVKKGQKIERGEVIGMSGNTGRSTAPHLHYEVHYYGTPQNPMDYFFSGYLK